jgi:hypothetical protein
MPGRLGRGAVEIAGGLVRQHDERLVGQRAGDRDPLTLAPGQRRGQEAGPVSQADPLQQAGGPRPCRPRRASGQQSRQLHVLRGGELVHQVEGLEDETDGLAPQPRQGPFAHLIDAPPGQVQLPGGRPFQPAGQVQQCRLPAAAGPHHCHRLTRGDVRVDPSTARTSPAALPNSLSSPRVRTTGIVLVMIHPSPRSSAVRIPLASAGPPGAGARVFPAAARNPCGPACPSRDTSMVRIPASGRAPRLPGCAVPWSQDPGSEACGQGRHCCGNPPGLCSAASARAGEAGARHCSASRRRSRFRAVASASGTIGAITCPPPADGDCRRG